MGSLQHWCCCSHTAGEQHLCSTSHAITITFFILHSSIFAVDYAEHSTCAPPHFTSAVSQQLCSFARTTRSTSANAENDAGRREPRQAGEGGLLEGGFFKRGGPGGVGLGGGACYVSTFPQQGCMTAEEIKGGFWFWARTYPVWAKRGPIWANRV